MLRHFGVYRSFCFVFLRFLHYSSGPSVWLDIFIRVQATLQAALSVRLSARRLVCLSVTLLLFFINFVPQSHFRSFKGILSHSRCMSRTRLIGVGLFIIAPAHPHATCFLKDYHNIYGNIYTYPQFLVVHVTL